MTKVQTVNVELCTLEVSCVPVKNLLQFLEEESHYFFTCWQRSEGRGIVSESCGWIPDHGSLFPNGSLTTPKEKTAY